MAFYPANSKNHPVTIIIPGDEVPCLDISEKTGHWMLICGYQPVRSWCHQSAPLVWSTLDTASNYSFPQGWPQPSPMQSVRDTLKISAGIIPVFSDGTTALSFQTAGCTCLLIDRDFNDESTISDTLKENVDLLIMSNNDQSAEKIKNLRSKIRPCFLITSAHPDDKLKEFTNILYLKNASPGFEFEIQSGKKVSLKATSL